jgi:hypothetical protein
MAGGPSVWKTLVLGPVCGDRCGRFMAQSRTVVSPPPARTSCGSRTSDGVPEKGSCRCVGSYGRLRRRRPGYRLGTRASADSRLKAPYPTRAPRTGASAWPRFESRGRRRPDDYIQSGDLDAPAIRSATFSRQLDPAGLCLSPTSKRPLLPPTPGPRPVSILRRYRRAGSTKAQTAVSRINSAKGRRYSASVEVGYFDRSIHRRRSIRRPR